MQFTVSLQEKDVFKGCNAQTATNPLDSIYIISQLDSVLAMTVHGNASTLTIAGKIWIKLLTYYYDYNLLTAQHTLRNHNDNIGMPEQIWMWKSSQRKIHEVSLTRLRQNSVQFRNIVACQICKRIYTSVRTHY